MNSAILVGRVGQDPEIKYFESGKSKTTFSIAVNRWNPKTKEREADWFNIQLWDKKAESAAEWVKKGSMGGMPSIVLKSHKIDAVCNLFLWKPDGMPCENPKNVSRASNPTALNPAPATARMPNQ